jgi:hypothetical protein
MPQIRKNMTTQEYESTGTLETVAGGVGGGAYQCEGPGGGENTGGEVSQAPPSYHGGGSSGQSHGRRRTQQPERGRQGEAGVFDELDLFLCCRPSATAAADAARRRRCRSREREDCLHRLVSIGDLFHGVRVVFFFPAKMTGIRGK